jgi:glucosamine--fructose-6-phosphate aminotransferase (isomerizing)
MSRTLEESLEAPDRLADLLARDGGFYAALAARLRLSPPPAAFTVARGSSDHAAAYGAYLIAAATGRPVASLPPSVVSLERVALEVPGHLALAVSQSGRSPDVVACLKAARTGGAVAVACVNETGSPLADAAEIVLPHHAGPERAVAATKSFINSAASLARLAAAWSGDGELGGRLEALPAALRAAADVGLAADPGWAEGVGGHAYVVARGAGLPVARELALKLKEVCGLHAEAFSSAELRHGPREIVDGRFAVLALALPGPGKDDVLAAARELADQGATVLVAGPPGSFLPLPEALDPRLAPLAAAQAFYPLLARTAEALGRDPDRPRTLAKVTLTV